MKIDKQALIAPKRLEFPYSWVGHIPFASWIINELKPKIFVELGTHSGNSYFAFCQSIQENNLSTRAYAVDTWQGDEHAGFYGEEVFKGVNSYNKEHYNEFSTLLRMTFDEAVNEFQDGSIDLLHIDGLHTYAAVKHDFETWLPKLSSRAVVLFHDTVVKERGFGVYKFWDEVKGQYPGFNFEHSHGLGVLLVGKEYTKTLKRIAEDPRAFSDAKEVFEVLGETVSERALLNEAVAERDAQIAGLNEAVAERDAQIAGLNEAVAELNRIIAEYRESTSWKITAPLRWPIHQVKRAMHLIQIIPLLIARHGGSKKAFAKTLHVIHKEGFQGLKHRLKWNCQQAVKKQTNGIVDRNDYAEWVRRYDTMTDEKRELLRKRIAEMARKPLISVVMPTYNPSPVWLAEAIESVQHQLYSNWELCIADDGSTDPEIKTLLNKYAKSDSRIKVVFREQNGHISAASNSALELASGDWVAFLDHDDVLPEHALFWVADAINQNPEAELIYSDEDKLDDSGNRVHPYFKPDWNYDLFLSHNYICHLVVYRHTLIKKVGGFRVGYEGAQDYDLALRCVEILDPEKIIHIPRVLYHWRIHQGSTAMAADEKKYALLAGEKALNDHFRRQKVAAKAEILDLGYRVHYELPRKLPLVSIIIPTRNGLNLIRQCVKSVISKTTYPNYEIIIIDNNSDDPDTLRYLDDVVRHEKVRVLHDPRPFNYSQLNNSAVEQAKGEFILLMNNDIEVITPDWLNEMVSIGIQKGVGCVGARLWYPNDTLQHGGVIGGLGGVAGHSHKYLPRGAYGYCGRATLIQSLIGVTAACLLVRKKIYEEVGGLNEKDLKVAFNDVDFCLKVREAGYRNIWTPFAELYHHESATRGHEDTPEKIARFSKEVLYMKETWGDVLLNDPAYNPNLTLDYEDFSLAWPPRLEV
ncbi:MAG: glycosyltransferase [Methanobacteriota archaeon]|nr:MAG: glycosyltransferase [Euryarchaeota archaeon]